MRRYRPYEMHCHTRHSDGSFLVPQLLESVAAYGYEGMALTDHNAVTGNAEATPELQARTCNVIPGIEWTTFYGHLLVLGCNRFVDWRFVTPDSIDEALAEIRSVDGIAGVAHPCEVGSPLMCGCNWEFHVTRWDLVDYVEIWSQEDPHARTKNDLALPWYDALLNEGHHLALTAGRDWHGPDAPGSTPLLTATYLGMDGENTTENAMNAIRAGRTYVTLGPTVSVEASQGQTAVSLGETISAGKTTVRIEVGETERRRFWTVNNVHVDTVQLISNGTVLAEAPYSGAPVEFSVELPAGWCRVELHGGYYQDSTGRIALTSPIYVTDGQKA